MKERDGTLNSIAIGAISDFLLALMNRILMINFLGILLLYILTSW